jgi:trehalose-6-phosphate synthase
MVVTPPRDGMNLVAMEFVTARVRNQGVLILSEFAGAARHLRQALLVNPYDIDGVADAYERALDMPASEQRRRMRALRAAAHRRDVHCWAQRALAAFAEPAISESMATKDTAP